MSNLTENKKPSPHRDANGRFVKSNTKNDNVKSSEKDIEPKYKEYFSDFPEEIKNKMLDRQEEEVGKRDFSVFENQKNDGFTWGFTEEGSIFWDAVIKGRNFGLFFEKYPKEEEFPYKEHFSYFHDEIKEKMMDYQEKYMGKRDFSIFEKHLSSGFRWTDTPEGFDFWDKVICKKDFSLFFEKYPKEDKESLYKEHFSDFPEEVKNKMMDRQEEQGNKRDFKVFELEKDDGFVWKDTPEGHTFWEQVILRRNFALFFEKYAKKEETKEGDITPEIFYDCLEKKDLTRLFPTKESREKALKHNSNFCPLVYFDLEKCTLFASNGCEDCPMNCCNRDLFLSLPPFNGNVSREEVFEKLEEKMKTTVSMKYAVRDEVWTMYNNCPQKGVIKESYVKIIDVDYIRIKTEINYTLVRLKDCDKDEEVYRAEDKIFRTKEDLLASFN